MTVGEGQSFKGVVTPKILDPDTVSGYPQNSQRGFASMSGSDGTVLECVYAVINEQGNGLGTCLDNRENRYRLTF